MKLEGRRRAIFSPKSKDANLRGGRLTKDGLRLFREARKRLAALVGWKIQEVSEADTIEALARGWEGTETYLKK